MDRLFRVREEPTWRAAESELAAELSEQVNVGAGDAGVGDVAEDGDIQVFEGTFAIANGKRVQQPLRRMLVRAVAGVDHGNFQVTRDKIGGTGRGMAHDKTIRFHGVQIVRGVKKRFAFFQAGGFGLKIHGVCAESRSGGAEAEACARGVFEEGKSDGFAAKRGQFFEGMFLNFLEWLCLIKKKGEFVRGERFKR